MVKNKDAYRILVGKPARKRLLGRFRRRWEDKSKMYPLGMRMEGVDWIFLNLGRHSWQAVVNRVTNIRVL
jgi:hypothetical protein